MKPRTGVLLVGALFGPMALAQTPNGAPAPMTMEAPVRQAAGASTLEDLVAEAVRSNPELAAARHEVEAARQRIAPAGALDDPMVEAGVLNFPTNSYRLNREDMTMKMLGISQKLPWPGKRRLREQVLEREAQTLELGLRETANRVARDVKAAYFDLALATETLKLTRESRQVLQQLLAIAQSRYRVGQASQAEVLKLQTQLAKMSEELLRMERELPVAEAEIAHLTGHGEGPLQIAAVLSPVAPRTLDSNTLLKNAIDQRAQLAGLKMAIERADANVDVARSEYKPDFELRAAYGQRENMLDGTRRPDVASVTVAINVPLWNQSKRDPKLAEARALREQAVAMYEAQQHEISMKLRQQIAIAEQSRKSVELYSSTILPQGELAYESALTSYRVSRSELPMTLDAQMSLFSYRAARIAALAVYHKALAEIDWLSGAGTKERQ